MKKTLIFLIILSFSISIFSQENCLKVIKNGKKEFVILSGQKIKIELPNKKNYLKCKKCIITEINDSSFVVDQIRSELNKQVVRSVNDLEYIGFKTRSSIFWGRIHDVIVVLDFIIPGGITLFYFSGTYRFEYIKNEKWRLEISKIDYSSINPKRKTAIKYSLKKSKN